MFNNKPNFIKGSSKKEKTKDELLAEVRAQRAARQGQRQQAASAVTIQACWRGWRARSQLSSSMLQEVLTEITPLALDPQRPVQAQWVADWLLPRLFYLFQLPDDPTLPISLACQAQNANTQKGVASQLSKAIRASLAVLMRSLTSASTDHNYLAIGVHLAQQPQSQSSNPGSQSKPLTNAPELKAWLRQASHLMRLCAALIAAPTGTPPGAAGLPAAGVTSDAIVDAAAVRIVCLMSDVQGWKVEGLPDAKELLAHQLLTQSIHQHAALFAAVTRTTPAESTSPASPYTAHSTKLAMVVSKVLLAVDDAAPGVGSEEGVARGPTWQLFARLLLTRSGILQIIGNDVWAQLCTARVVQVLCSCLLAAVSGTCTGISPSSSRTKPLNALITAKLTATQALWAMSHLTLFSLNAPLQSITTKAQLSDIGHLKEPFLARAYCQVGSRLLVSASHAGGTEAGSAVGYGLWPLAQRSVVTGLLGVMERQPGGMTLLSALWSESLALCQELAKSLTAAKRSDVAGGIPSILSCLSFTPHLLPVFWRWLAGQVGLPLEAPKEASRGLSVTALRLGYQSLTPQHALVLGLFCRLYHHLLLVVDDEEFHAGGGHTGNSSSPAKRSPTPLDSHKTGSLSVGQARAVVTSLNTLVYHTYLPARDAKSSSIGRSDVGNDGSVAGLQAGLLISSGPDTLLTTYAPQLLRSLYERNSRRAFCQPQLWLAPYDEMFGNVEAAIASHHKALLQARDAADQAALQQGSDSDDDQQQARERPGAAVRGFFNNLLSSGRSETARNRASGGSNIWSRGSRAAAADEGGSVLTGLMAWGGLGEAAAANRPPDPRDSLIGPLRAQLVVNCFLGNGQDKAEEGEEEQELPGVPGVPSLKVKVGGLRPDSFASLLRTAPQAVPFERRVDLFRALLAEDKVQAGIERSVNDVRVPGARVPTIEVVIRRAYLMEDAYRALAHLGRDLRARLHVTFINEQGLSEAGMDLGGLMKEFLEEVVVKGFHADAGLWATCPASGHVYPRPTAHKMDSGIQLLQFLGLMVGKALYEGILLNVAFAPFFITRLQGRIPMLDDLQTLDPDLHKSLLQVKQYEGDVSDLGLTFCVEEDYFGQTTQHALIPGQSNTPVTNQNRLLYCHLLADWHLNVQLGRAADAFNKGLSCIIPPASLRLFSPQEFNQLVSGGDGEGGALDVKDMKRYVVYSGGYHAGSSTIRALWQVLEGFSAAERGMFLRFCTSCSRAPLGGFRHLQPALTIQKISCDASVLAVLGGKDVDRLPSASTCFNTLKLPDYRRKETLRTKLLYAINSGAGFELS